MVTECPITDSDGDSLADIRNGKFKLRLSNIILKLHAYLNFVVLGYTSYECKVCFPRNHKVI